MQWWLYRSLAKRGQQRKTPPFLNLIPPSLSWAVVPRSLEDSSVVPGSGGRSRPPTTAYSSMAMAMGLAGLLDTAGARWSVSSPSLEPWEVKNGNCKRGQIAQSKGSVEAQALLENPGPAAGREWSSRNKPAAALGYSKDQSRSGQWQKSGFPSLHTMGYWLKSSTSLQRTTCSMGGASVSDTNSSGYVVSSSASEGTSTGRGDVAAETWIHSKDLTDDAYGPSFSSSVRQHARIHPTAVIHSEAIIGEDVEIGPFCYVGPAKLGRGCRLYAHSQVVGDTELGEGCILMSGAIVGEDIPGKTILGPRNRVGHYAIVGVRCQDLKYVAGSECFLTIGEGNDIREHASIHRSSRPDLTTIIGNNNLIMGSCHVGHDCVIGNRNVMANGTLLAGHVVMEDFAHTGGAVAVHQFCHIGSHAFLAGGSMADRDVPTFTMVAGDRAVLRGLNLEGMRRSGFTDAQVRRVKTAYAQLFMRTENELQDRLAAVEQSELGTEPCVARLVESVKGSLQEKRRGVCKYRQ